VIAQSFTGYECILVDDGSPDKCPAICDEYAEKDARFKVIHKENGGLSDARNVGIQAAVGEYIVLLDSDDLLADNAALYNLSNVIEQTKAEVIINSNLTTFTETSRNIYDSINKDFISGGSIQFYKQLIRNKRMVLAGCLAVCLRRFLIENNLFFKKNILHEDLLWMPQIICAANNIAINHKLFYAYRSNRDGSITSIINKKHLLSKIEIIKDLLLLSELNNKKPTRKLHIFRDFNAYLWTALFNQSILLAKYYSLFFMDIINELHDLAYILRYSKRIRHLCYYLIIKIVGIKNAFKLKLVLFKTNKK
jgi:glycosyltransferase involved in cell wall biosynthesis